VACTKKEEPRTKGFNAEITKRNIGGSFIDWNNWVTSFAPSFSSGEERRPTFLPAWKNLW